LFYKKPLLAIKYDTRKKQFITVNKDELLDDIVDERMCDINLFYEELKEELDERTKEILDKVKDKIENDLGSYKEIKKKYIKLIIYNNRKKVSKELGKKLEIED
jgi:trans-2-enoyl-CoA reductase